MNYENTRVSNITCHTDNFCDEGLLRTLGVIKPKEEPIEVFKVNLLGNELVNYKIRVRHG